MPPYLESLPLRGIGGASRRIEAPSSPAARSEIAPYLENPAARSSTPPYLESLPLRGIGGASRRIEMPSSPAARFLMPPYHKNLPLRGRWREAPHDGCLLSSVLCLLNSGFTLLELLLVCVLLAAISMLAFGAYANVDRQAENELAKTQALTLASALKRFHDDTGYWPGEGPFRGVEEGGCDAASVASGNGGAIDLATDWVNSPANMSLLFERPQLCEKHPLAALKTWEPDTGRGWRGPYLPLLHRRLVDAAAWDDNTMDWLSNSTVVVKNMPAFGAGPAFAPDGAFWRWRSLPDGSDSYDRSRHEFREHARPLLFLLDPPRVVYWGADGEYDGTVAVDDSDKNERCAGRGDDWVACL
ncbi:MAG: prepilin-type N-terminal cleavage/methylation domain-containing protein [Zoogloeaceae bacterium]|nr:prepilin-type N-terminal cleavage/methylation domain-containing protein [Zoogloeaceae bacterium]